MPFGSEALAGDDDQADPSLGHVDRGGVRPFSTTERESERRVPVTTDSHISVRRERWAWTHDNERLGIYLLIFVLAAWFITMATITGILCIQHGYGLGIFDHQHVPTAIVKQIGVGDNLQKMMEATNRP
jgi:hypothetical protein